MMNPFEILGWLLAGLFFLALLVGIFLAILVIRGFFEFLKEERRKRKVIQEAMEKGILAFDTINVGTDLIIARRKWRVLEIEQDYDIDFNQDKVMIMLRADRDDLLYGP